MANFKVPRQVEIVLRESAGIVRMEHGVIISRTHHGFVCANAGVDASNVGGEDIATGIEKKARTHADETRQKAAQDIDLEAQKAQIQLRDDVVRLTLDAVLFSGDTIETLSLPDTAGNLSATISIEPSRWRRVRSPWRPSSVSTSPS